MARVKLPEGEKKEVVQVLFKGKGIEQLGGKSKCAVLCAEFLANLLAQGKNA